MLDLVFRVVAFAAGVLLIIHTVLAAIRSFVLPRNESVLLNNVVFTSIRFVFEQITRFGRTYAQRDRIMALYAPVGLVALPIVWLAVISLGFTAIYWALHEGSWLESYQLSGSSLLTLGTHKTRGPIITIFTFAEATMGLLLLTLLISYLPTMYQAFSRRELVVARLELRSSPSHSATDLVVWLNRAGSSQDNNTQWQDWEEWFVEIEETHTSLPILSFFRSPQPGRSWVTAAGIILDAAALLISTVAQPRNPNVEICFKAGCVAMNRVTRFFHERAHVEPAKQPEDKDPPIEDPRRQDFMSACEQLQAAGLQLQPDLEQAWKTYHSLRGRYTEALDFLARLTMSPDQRMIGNEQ
ncbi:hypothetical protein J0X19_09790 [Hymenobacter sp. BT186]|uniref:Two pore domain potassium channel family protein n=1 Tax=Hymenobacter telluris TaxID=2816474 RepID=A0A939EVJ8_9BACT|nr:hypothetical protein [Hymenobacter telluris]MBO0358233.1 hypothetical protein [Hymenobacter telluris]MBW3374259.1 hypothetical protein [Hymenobacter norwichensis]